MNNNQKSLNHEIKNNPFILKMMSNKNSNIHPDDLIDLSSTTVLALENTIIQKALIKNQITLKDIHNISDIGLSALDYPTIKRCLSNKINLFFSKIKLKEIFEIKTKDEFTLLLKKYQTNIKRNPLFIFLSPVEMLDQIHELKQTIRKS